jgi:hypothetical protein
MGTLVVCRIIRTSDAEVTAIIDVFLADCGAGNRAPGKKSIRPVCMAASPP